MKNLFVCMVLITTILKSFAQERPYVQFNYTLPESFATSYENDRLLVFNEENKVCVIIYSPYKAGNNIGDNFMQLWNTPQKNIEGYLAGEVNKKSNAKINGYQVMSGDFEGESNGQTFINTLKLYQDGNICNAVLGFADNQTNEQLQPFWKSLAIKPKAAAAVQLSPPERSYNWYRALRGTDASNSSIQIYQSQTAINFTGFNTPSQNHLQTLGDSLFYLRELPNLQMLFIGQTRFTDAAAINIGTLKAIKHVQSMDQGFPIPLTNAGLQGLGNATALEVLNLQAVEFAGITDAGMAHLARLTNLKILTLSRATGITIRGIEQLVTLKQLRERNLSYCALSDTDIPRLTTVMQQLPALQKLFIQTSNITQAGADQLRQSFPNIII